MMHEFVTYSDGTLVVSSDIRKKENGEEYLIVCFERPTENGFDTVIFELPSYKIVKKDGNLKIENSSLNLSTIFENYQGIGENYLDLNTFIDDYKKYEKSNYEENEKEIIMKTKSNNNNKYTENKILYINKENKLPTKLIIEDNNQNTTINIQYNSIELN